MEKLHTAIVHMIATEYWGSLPILPVLVLKAHRPATVDILRDQHKVLLDLARKQKCPVERPVARREVATI